MAKDTKFIDLHEVIVERHGNDSIVLSEDSKQVSTVCFGVTYTEFKTKAAALKYFMSPEEREIRFGTSGTVMNPAVDEIKKNEEEWNREVAPFYDAMVAEDAKPFSEFCANVNIPSRFIETTEITICSDYLEISIRGLEKKVRQNTNWATEFSGAISLGNLFKGMEFISRLKGFVLKTVKDVYGEDAQKGLETALESKIPVGFKIDWFALFEALKTIDIEYETFANDTASFTIKLNLVQMYKLAYGKDSLKKLNEQKGIDVEETIFKTFSVMIYNLLGTMESVGVKF